MMKTYVVGFAFNKSRPWLPIQVLLVRKEKPAWQAGKWNGLGGKVEADETPVAAMVREFAEEAQIVTSPGEWREVASLRHLGNTIHVFAAVFDDQVRAAAAPPGGEQLSWFDLPLNDYTDLVPNLRYLVPLAEDPAKNIPVFEYAE